MNVELEVREQISSVEALVHNAASVVVGLEVLVQMSQPWPAMLVGALAISHRGPP